MNLALYRSVAARRSGSVLIAGLIICGLIGITLASYLVMLRSQRFTVARSQAWNGALAMAEAGVEEALSQLNPLVPAPAAVDRSANGWGSPVNNIYGPKIRTLALGKYAVCYTANTFP